MAEQIHADISVMRIPKENMNAILFDQKFRVFITEVFRQIYFSMAIDSNKKLRTGSHGDMSMISIRFDGEVTLLSEMIELVMSVQRIVFCDQILVSVCPERVFLTRSSTPEGMEERRTSTPEGMLAWTIGIRVWRGSAVTRSSVYKRRISRTETWGR